MASSNAGHADEVLFAFLALVLGILTKICLAWTHFPYTVIMLVNSAFLSKVSLAIPFQT